MDMKMEKIWAKEEDGHGDDGHGDEDGRKRKTEMEMGSETDRGRDGHEYGQDEGVEE